MSPKVGFFAWEATWGKALTLDQIQRRGWSLANKCFFCYNEEESIDLIFIHCVKVSYMAVAFCSFWHVLGALFFDWRYPSRLIWFFCGQKALEDLDGSLLVHLVDCFKGKDQNCFLKLKAKKLFCL